MRNIKEILDASYMRGKKAALNFRRIFYGRHNEADQKAQIPYRPQVL